VAVEVFQGPLLEVNEQILAVAAGREAARAEVSFSWSFLPCSYALPKQIFLCGGYRKY